MKQVKYFQIQHLKDGTSYYRRFKDTHLDIPRRVDTTEDAERYSNMIVAAQMQAALATASGKIEIGEMIVEYRKSPDFKLLSEGTRKNYATAFKALFSAKVGDQLLGYLTSIDHKQLDLLKQDMLRNHSPARTEDILAVLRLVFGHAVRMGYLDTNILKTVKIKRGTSRKTVWKDHEFKAVIDYCDDHLMYGLSDALYLMRYLLQRPVDVIAMRQADLENDEITFVQQKTGTELCLPISGVLKERLDQRAEALKQSNHSPEYLTTDNGTPWTSSSLSAAFREVREALGLRHLTMRDLRRTGAVVMAKRGYNLMQIRSWTGHKTLQALEVYLPPIDQMQIAQDMNAD